MGKNDNTNLGTKTFEWPKIISSKINDHTLA
uniref:Uncharacterized protein n=1 Tax=Arundo donax TaxID=35708 RepID=A0A0A9C1I9_ARUDO